MPSLLVLFLLPYFCSLLMFVLPSSVPTKRIALFLSLLPLALLLYNHANWVGTSIQYKWIPPLSIEFYLRVDELSLLFLYLTAFIIPISIIAVPIGKLSSTGFFYGLIFLLQGLLIGFFTARDLALFTLLWEAMLLPLYFIISLWGGAKRRSAALKFLIYMIAGSALMLAAVLSLYFSATLTVGSGTFNLDQLAKISANITYAPWLCAIFILAFSVKTPLFPFHAWLPDAYYQASTTGTILLAGLLSKAGVYGFLRITLEIFPQIMKEWSPLLLGLAIAGVLYGGLAAWAQNDFKRLIAYSSLSHINFVLAGLFIWNQMAQSGAILQAINHGVTITALFLVAGWLEERLGSTTIGHVSGLAKFMPHLCWLTLFFVLSSVALPGLNNFIGELMILLGIFTFHPFLTALLGLTVIISVIYMLRWMQKVYFEEPSFFQENWIDIRGKEWAVAIPLIAVILWIGIYPSPVLKQTEAAAASILAKGDEQ